MSVDADELRALSTSEKLRLVEFLWDDLGESTAPIPLPAWVVQEAAKRRDEMRDPKFGLSHDEVWARIEHRNVFAITHSLSATCAKPRVGTINGQQALATRLSRSSVNPRQT